SQRDAVAVSTDHCAEVRIMVDVVIQAGKAECDVRELPVAIGHHQRLDDSAIAQHACFEAASCQRVALHGLTANVPEGSNQLSCHQPLSTVMAIPSTKKR